MFIGKALPVFLIGRHFLSFIWSPPCPRAHSLHYNLTVVSQDGSLQSGFFAEGQLDGQPFLSYDSEKSRAEPQGLWAEAVLGAETWDAEAEDLMEKGKDLKMTLADVMALQDQKGDFHSLQEFWGCEIQEDNSSMGLWNFYCDGELFLSYNPKTHGWIVYQSSPQTLAMEIKNPGTQITFKARITVPMCRERRKSGGAIFPQRKAQSGFGATEGEFLREYKIIFWNQVNICLPPIPPEVVSLQVLDQHQRAPTDLSGTMPLGFQSGAWNLQPGGQNSAPCSGLTSTFPLGASVSSSKKWKR
uniref:MHC class I-like antigen recognition-like domain-containing protein n=1 Tax=Equus asinus asinus TaxID=83772 RepID=A0A8C4KVG1_EQUAS